MKQPSFFLTTLAASLLLISGCEMLRGMDVGGIDLTPLADAGEKIAKAGPASAQEEQQIGRHMAGTLLGASPLSKQIQQQRYVNKVGRWLTLHSSRPQLDWHFAVLADDDINAFAAPGGYVFITSGLLNILDNEAELAGVLAHEISHVTQKHHLAAVRNNNLMGAALDVGSLVGDAATGGNSSTVQRDIGAKIANASRELYARGLDKGDEYEADNEALRLMTLSGYDPYAFVVVMQKLDARSSNDSGMALLLQTHPRPSDRLKAMNSDLASLNITGPQATLEQRFRREVR
jgi:predicted Zn-dependent protease